MTDPAVAGTKVCEQPCQHSSDCGDLQTFCQAGMCHLSACGPNDGNADAACTTGDGQPGSCITAVDPDGDPAHWVWGCSLAGTSTAGCNPAQLHYRGDLTARCAAGMACDLYTQVDTCVRLCVPDVDVCPNGGYCVAQDGLGNIGYCE